MRKLYLIKLDMSSFFVHLRGSGRYFCVIHSSSTLNPHKIVQLSTYLPFSAAPGNLRYLSGNTKKQTDGSRIPPFNMICAIPGKCTSICLSGQFLLLFTALIIVSQLQSVKLFCPTVSDTLLFTPCPATRFRQHFFIGY